MSLISSSVKLIRVATFFGLAVFMVAGLPDAAGAVVKTYYAQEDGTCGSSYGTGGNVFKPAAEGDSGSCTVPSTIGGRWQTGTRDYLIAYTPVYAVQTTITGQASGSNIPFQENDRDSFTGRVRFVEVNAAGDTILGNLTGETTINVPRNASRFITDLSGLSGTINAGNRLGLVVSATNPNDADARTYFGDNGGGQSNETWFAVDEAPAGGGGGSVSGDAVGTCFTSATGQPGVDCTITVGSCSDRLLLVYALYDGNEPIDTPPTARVTLVNAGQDILPNLEVFASGGSTNTTERVKIFSFANPSPGAETVEVRWNTNNNHYAAIVRSFCGVDTADPIGATGLNAGNNSSPFVNITTTVADSLITGAVSQGGTTTFTPQSGTSEIVDFDTGGGGSNTADSSAALGEKDAPTTGSYGLNFTSGTTVNWAFAAVEVKPAPSAGNSPPTLIVNQPDGTGDTIAEDGSFTINYDLADSDDIVTAAFFYDNNNSGFDGTAIDGGCATAAEGAGATCNWDTTGLAAGTYYIYGVVNDGINPAVQVYSSGPVTINAPPTLTISQPDGVGDNVTQGNNFSIVYNLADSDDTVTAAFYYDTDNAGFDGTQITDASCLAAAEGTGANCTWNTTGDPIGSFYIYGIVDDGSNPTVQVYSTGQVTIDAPPVNNIIAGVAAAVVGGTNSIDVSMPYGGDIDNDAFFDVEYRTCGGSFSAWMMGGTTPATPYTDTITGLTDGACYDVRMTYNDPDGVTGTAVQTVSGINLPTNRTTPGTVIGSGTSATTIRITAPYSNDANANNTLRVEYKETAAPSYTVWAPDPVPHTVTPFIVNVTGLTESTTYDIRVTFNDADGFNGGQPQVQTFQVNTPSAYSPSGLLHNSDNLGTKYWSGSGWGVPGGQYGAFTCMTCHEINPANGNIKRVRTVINGQNVAFSKVSGPGDSFGDDSDGRGGANSTRVCEACHTQTDYHRKTTSSTPDLTHNNQADCMLCHPHNKGFKPEGACDACHAVGTSSPAPKIVDTSGSNHNGEAYGTHLKVTAGQNLSGVADWATQCLSCHGMHTGDVLVPNNPAVGIDYSHGGVYLGGTATKAGAVYEAEICWDCHDTEGVSEWRPMQDNDGFTVSGGSNWLNASFDSAGSSIPTRPTYSMHTANAIDVESPAPATPGVGSNATVRSSSVANNIDWATNVGELKGARQLELASSIRCSYCHDVHGTANYSGVIAAGDDPDAKPYLRGTWLSNPYPVERPPETGDNYPGNVYPNFSGSGPNFPAGFNTPRLFSNSAGSATEGGFFIDQNSGYPTRKGDNTYMTVEEVGGLCVICHTNNVDGMNYYNNTDELWQGVNGHSNAVVSGTGSNAVDLFDARRGNNTYNMHFQGLPSGAGNDRRWGDSHNGSTMPNGGSFNGSRPDRRNNHFLPPRNTGWYGGTPGATNRNPSAEYNRWYNGSGGAAAIGTNGDGFTTRAHSFSCSKCHAPHASGLPALLITNCLDPMTGTWTASLNTTVGPGAWVTGSEANTRNRWNAMGNCHRKESTSTGWNRLAPGQ